MKVFLKLATYSVTSIELWRVVLTTVAFDVGIDFFVVVVEVCGPASGIWRLAGVRDEE